MRLYGRRNKSVWRRRVKAHSPKLPRLLVLTAMDCRGKPVSVAIQAGSLPPRGSAQRPARIGGKRLSAAITDQERYWRSKAPRHARHKPKAAHWSDWRLSQGFKGGKWLPSQLRKAPKPSKAGRP